MQDQSQDGSLEEFCNSLVLRFEFSVFIVSSTWFVNSTLFYKLSNSKKLLLPCFSYFDFGFDLQKKKTLSS